MFTLFGCLRIHQSQRAQRCQLSRLAGLIAAVLLNQLQLPFYRPCFLHAYRLCMQPLYGPPPLHANRRYYRAASSLFLLSLFSIIFSNIAILALKKPFWPRGAHGHRAPVEAAAGALKSGPPSPWHMMLERTPECGGHRSSRFLRCDGTRINAVTRGLGAQ